MASDAGGLLETFLVRLCYQITKKIRKNLILLAGEGLKFRQSKGSEH